MFFALCQKNANAQNSSKAVPQSPRFDEFIVPVHEDLSQTFGVSDKHTIFIEKKRVSNKAFIWNFFCPSPLGRACGLLQDSTIIANEKIAAL